MGVSRDQKAGTTGTLEICVAGAEVPSDPFIPGETMVVDPGIMTGAELTDSADQAGASP